MTLPRETLALLRRAMLPMDGTIADHAEPILAAAFDALGDARDAGFAYVDLTAGSCLLPLAFAAAGARRLVVNDIAARTIVAAQALFAGDDLAPGLLADAHAGRCARTPHAPSFAFASDYLTEEACAGFDLLFHAELPARRRATLRYLALRDVLDFADPEDGFRILMTHDRDQLRADREQDWSGFLAAHDGRLDRLERRRADLAQARSAIGAPHVRILNADMRDVAAAIDYRGPCLVAVNPPTNGVDEYVIDDQIVHSLIANRLVPLTRCAETAAAFWRSRVETALAALPAGALFLVWGGDGAMTAEACRSVWLAHGDQVHAARVELGEGRAALWGIFRRR
jgi:predicted RNA methylase